MADYVYRKPKGRNHKRYGRADLGKLVYKHLRKHIPVYEIELQRLRDMWAQLVTPRIAARTFPAKFNRGVLRVYVHDNQWLHELGYLRQEIIKRLHQEPHFRNITSLELRLGRIPPPRVVPPPPPRAKALRPLGPSAPTSTREALDAVQDPELREVMRKAREALSAKEAEPQGEQIEDSGA